MTLSALLRVLLLLMGADVHLAAQAKAPEDALQIRPLAVDDAVFGGQVMTYSAGASHAPLVVLVHGLSRNAAGDWQGVIPMLAETYRVIAVDLPGFGRSTGGNHLYSPDAMATAVRGAVRQLDARPFTLVGHSMSGAIALAYARQFPDDLNRLVLVNLAGVLHHSVVAQGLSRLGVQSYAGADAEQAAWLTQLTQAVLAEADRLGISPTMLIATPWLRQMGLGGQPMAISALAMSAYDFGPALREVRTPTELIWGRDDAITPLRTGQLAAAMMADARLTVLDGAAHMPMFEAPEAFHAALRAAIAGRDTPPAARPQPRRPPTRRGVTHCLDEAGARFTGTLGDLDLTRCDDAVIENANLRSLRVQGGSVTLINSHVHEGIEARDTQLVLTAGSVTGDPALVLEDTRVDAAGTEFLLLGPHLAQNDGAAPLNLRFSVASRQPLGGEGQWLHRVVRVDRAW